MPKEYLRNAIWDKRFVMAYKLVQALYQADAPSRSQMIEQSAQSIGNDKIFINHLKTIIYADLDSVTKKLNEKYKRAIDFLAPTFTNLTPEKAIVFLGNNLRNYNNQYAELSLPDARDNKRLYDAADLISKVNQYVAKKKLCKAVIADVLNFVEKVATNEPVAPTLTKGSYEAYH